MRSDKLPTIELPVTTMSVPVMIALLARIQDQLQADEITNPVAVDVAIIIAALLELREEAHSAMVEVDGEQATAVDLAPNQSKLLC